MNDRQRLGGIITLLAILGGLCVWYGSLAPAPAVGAYPSDTDIATDNDEYINSMISVTGTVESTNPVQLCIETEAGLLRLTVHGVAVNAAVGDRLHIFGELRNEQIIEAENTVRVPPTGLWYMYGVSLLGGTVVLARLIRDWTIDITTWTLCPRDSECTFRQSLRGWFGGRQ